MKCEEERIPVDKLKISYYTKNNFEIQDTKYSYIEFQYIIIIRYLNLNRLKLRVHKLDMHIKYTQ